MNIRIRAGLMLLLAAPLAASAQVTHGKPPQLPRPFATQSAGNGPDTETPPAGFLPAGVLWTAVNERDELGDDLPPDYLTSVQDGGFYGWPYSYIGNNVDPRVKPQKPEQVAKAIVPDVLLGPHVAPLQFAFYTGKQFPASYQGGVFVAEHGSWNRAMRSGYNVSFVGFKNGKAEVDPVPFLVAEVVMLFALLQWLGIRRIKRRKQCV